MKINGVILKSLLVGAISLACGNALAGVVTIGSATAQVGGGATNPAAIPVSFTASGPGDVTVGFECRIYTPAGLTFVSVATESPADTVAAYNAVDGYLLVNVVSPTNTLIANGIKANATYTVDAGAVDGEVFALEGVLNGQPGCEHYDATAATISRETVDGAITVIAEGPPTISFDEAPIVLSGVYGTEQTDTVAVTVTDGGGNNPADTASYTCTAPAGISVSPLTGGPIVNGGSLADLTVSCTLGDTEVSGNIECNATNTAGSDEDFTIPVTCEAGSMAPPILTPTPADGSTITTGAGAPGQVGTGPLVVTPSGGAGVDPATITCSPSTASLTVSPAGVQSFLPGAAARTFSVGCTLTQEPQEFMGGVTCSGTDGDGDFEWSFDVSCPAGVIAPTFVPASSLWSKLALFGIFAALGLLVLGLRRNH